MIRKNSLGITSLSLAAILITAVLWTYTDHRKSDYFVLRVIDEDTGRGVPLVELILPNEVTYWTDSAGVAALNEPSLNGREVFLTIRSHGYEYKQGTVFGRGTLVTVEPGKMQTLQIHRTMIAERLYRLTGEGIYRDSILAGLPAPVEKPFLNAQVLGLSLPVIDESRFNLIQGNLPLFLLMISLAWTTIAFGEELFYRAFLISRLVDHAAMGKGGAITISALFFGAAHFAEGPLGILSNGAFGGLFGWRYFKGGRNLWITVIGHGLLNTFRFTLLYMGAA